MAKAPSQNFHFKFRSIPQRQGLEAVISYLSKENGVDYSLADGINLAIFKFVESHRQQNPDIFRALNVTLNICHQAILEMVNVGPQEPRQLFEAVTRVERLNKDAFNSLLQDLIEARKIKQVERVTEKNKNRILYVAFNARLGDDLRLSKSREIGLSEDD